MGQMIKEVVSTFQRGKTDVFKQIVDYYFESVFQICFFITGNTKTAEILAEKTFIYAYSNIHSYHSLQKYSVWLYQVSIKLAISHFDFNSPDNDYSKVTTDRFTFELTDMHRILMNLALEERITLVLKHREELSIKEISEVLDTTEAFIRSTIWQGREKLRSVQLRNCL
ncbi:hypothetical protein LG329_16235 [Virgibacillus necropolis]|uniref:sigma factor-like helix-turn-helix DNA-binding protein n=1 Tax=Virgibacillus necropolis TaxID=163877 RepID=UPI00384E247D